MFSLLCSFYGALATTALLLIDPEIVNDLLQTLDSLWELCSSRRRLLLLLILLLSTLLILRVINQNFILTLSNLLRYVLTFKSELILRFLVAFHVLLRFLYKSRRASCDFSGGLRVFSSLHRYGLREDGPS